MSEQRSVWHFALYVVAGPANGLEHQALTKSACFLTVVWREQVTKAVQFLTGVWCEARGLRRIQQSTLRAWMALPMAAGSRSPLRSRNPSGNGAALTGENLPHARSVS